MLIAVLESAPEVDVAVTVACSFGVDTDDEVQPANPVMLMISGASDT